MDYASETLAALQGFHELSGDHRAAALKRADWIARADDADVARLLAAIGDLPNLERTATRPMLEAILAGLASWSRASQPGESGHQRSLVRQRIVALYGRLGRESATRHFMLQALAGGPQREDLAAMAELVVSDPPSDGTAIALAFSPLFQRAPWDPSAVFPRLLDGLGDPGVAAATLDLANFVCRRQLLPGHPALPRVTAIRKLFAMVVQRLAQIAQQPPEAADSLQRVQRAVADGVALAVSLCDAHALMRDTAAIPTLREALALPHRRVRAEAAAALARLGEADGAQALIELAAEPVARLRVLAYAEELQLLDRVEACYQTPAARAEAELVLWLAQPQQIGVPPSSCELVDECTQFWPGFDEPQACFLFRFTYSAGESEYRNIAIAGPLTHAFRADLQDLPPTDIYAAFAGWHAEHEELYETVLDEQTDPEQQPDVARSTRRLEAAEYTDVRPQLIGMFFGERIHVASATRNGVRGIAIVDPQEIHWRPLPVLPTEPSRRLSAEDVYSIYKGRRLLRAFNP